MPPVKADEGGLCYEHTNGRSVNLVMHAPMQPVCFVRALSAGACLDLSVCEEVLVGELDGSQCSCGSDCFEKGRGDGGAVVKSASERWRGLKVWSRDWQVG